MVKSTKVGTKVKSTPKEDDFKFTAHTPKEDKVKEPKPEKVKEPKEDKVKTETEIVNQTTAEVAVENAKDNGASQTDEISSNKGSRKNI